jgi:endonuclease/exonuclease/phosphatase family metal-dependent hydrolase
VPELSLASFNAHGGVDGWGRPYDLVDACRQLDADVIVLQETFAPLDGASQADELADQLGYTPVELPLARAWRRKEGVWHGKGWEPSKVVPTIMKALRVGGRVDYSRRSDLAGYEEGTWGLAVLCRHRIVTTEALELGRLKRDFTRRGALIVELDVGPAAGVSPPESEAEPATTSESEDRAPLGATAPQEVVLPEGNFTVIGTHAAHLSDGSPFQIRRLHRALPKDAGPAALAGDMNLWGPPVSLLLPGWRRAVRGRTWPAWRPHSQLDHILVNRAVTILEGEVVHTGNSDHLAVRALVRW